MFKILIVDDEATILQRLKRILHSSVHEVFVSASVEEAIGSARKHTPDLILADHNLSSLSTNGVNLGHEIRQALKKRILVIIMTGFPENEVQTSVHNFRFIPKPFTKKDILTTMDECLFAAYGPGIMGKGSYL